MSAWVRMSYGVVVMTACALALFYAHGETANPLYLAVGLAYAVMVACAIPLAAAIVLGLREPDDGPTAFAFAFWGLGGAALIGAGLQMGDWLYVVLGVLVSLRPAIRVSRR